MNSIKETITINVVYDEMTYELKTYAGEYRNLMMLIFDRIYIEFFGDCKGMGRCGTCTIRILDNHTLLPASDRNEAATLTKSGIATDGIRLSCQIMVDHLLNNATVMIPQEY